MALLNGGQDDEDAEDLLDELGADGEERARCDFYTGLFAFVFLNEQGVTFNDDGEEFDEERLEFLRETVMTWLA